MSDSKDRKPEAKAESLEPRLLLIQDGPSLATEDGRKYFSLYGLSVRRPTTEEQNSYVLFEDKTTEMSPRDLKEEYHEYFCFVVSKLSDLIYKNTGNFEFAKLWKIGILLDFFKAGPQESLQQELDSLLKIVTNPGRAAAFQNNRLRIVEARDTKEKFEKMLQTLPQAFQKSIREKIARRQEAEEATIRDLYAEVDSKAELEEKIRVAKSIIWCEIIAENSFLFEGFAPEIMSASYKNGKSMDFSINLPLPKRQNSDQFKDADFNIEDIPSEFDRFGLPEVELMAEEEKAIARVEKINEDKEKTAVREEITTAQPVPEENLSLEESLAAQSLGQLVLSLYRYSQMDDERMKAAIQEAIRIKEFSLLPSDILSLSIAMEQLKKRLQGLVGLDLTKGADEKVEDGFLASIREIMSLLDPSSPTKGRLEFFIGLPPKSRRMFVVQKTEFPASRSGADLIRPLSITFSAYEAGRLSTSEKKGASFKEVTEPSQLLALEPLGQVRFVSAEPAQMTTDFLQKKAFETMQNYVSTELKRSLLSVAVDEKKEDAANKKEALQEIEGLKDLIFREALFGFPLRYYVESLRRSDSKFLRHKLCEHFLKAPQVLSWLPTEEFHKQMEGFQEAFVAGNDFTPEANDLLFIKYFSATITKIRADQLQGRLLQSIKFTISCEEHLDSAPSTTDVVDLTQAFQKTSGVDTMAVPLFGITGDISDSQPQFGINVTNLSLPHLIAAKQRCTGNQKLEEAYQKAIEENISALQQAVKKNASEAYLHLAKDLFEFMRSNIITLKNRLRDELKVADLFGKQLQSYLAKFSDAVFGKNNSAAFNQFLFSSFVSLFNEMGVISLLQLLETNKALLVNQDIHRAFSTVMQQKAKILQTAHSQVQQQVFDEFFDYLLEERFVGKPQRGVLSDPRLTFEFMHLFQKNMFPNDPSKYAAFLQEGFWRKFSQAHPFSLVRLMTFLDPLLDNPIIFKIFQRALEVMSTNMRTDDLDRLAKEILRIQNKYFREEQTMFSDYLVDIQRYLFARNSSRFKELLTEHLLPLVAAEKEKYTKSQESAATLARLDSLELVRRCVSQHLEDPDGMSKNRQTRYQHVSKRRKEEIKGWEAAIKQQEEREAKQTSVASENTAEHEMDYKGVKPNQKGEDEAPQTRPRKNS